MIIAPTLTMMSSRSRHVAVAVAELDRADVVAVDAAAVPVADVEAVLWHPPVPLITGTAINSLRSTGGKTGFMFTVDGKQRVIIISTDFTTDIVFAVAADLAGRRQALVLLVVRLSKCRTQTSPCGAFVIGAY